VLALAKPLHRPALAVDDGPLVSGDVDELQVIRRDERDPIAFEVGQQLARVDPLDPHSIKGVEKPVTSRAQVVGSAAVPDEEHALMRCDFQLHGRPPFVVDGLRLRKMRSRRSRLPNT
jgi:hypothetical protein